MANLEELEARIRALEDETLRLRDIEAIKSLKHRYWHCIDDRDRKGLEDVFARDAEIHYGFGLQLQGNRVIARGLTTVTPKKFSMTIHLGHNPEIELVSDVEARGRWHLDQFAVERDNNAVVRIAGFYDDLYKKEDGSWRIRSSKVTHLYWHVPKKEEYSLTHPAMTALAEK